MVAHEDNESMKLFTCLCLLAVIATARPAFAQATIHGDLTKDWAGQKTLLVALANALPEDKYGFKPTPAQRTFGEHVLHIAQINVLLTKALGGKTPEPAINMKATTKADMIKAMSDSFDYGAKVIAEFNNTTIQETIQAPFMGPSTRARIMFFLNAHTQDTYGQMAVYLRLNGLTPPASAPRP
jgi:uncharacterized damage-inducible protein DinB